MREVQLYHALSNVLLYSDGGDQSSKKLAGNVVREVQLYHDSRKRRADSGLISEKDVRDVQFLHAR